MSRTRKRKKKRRTRAPNLTREALNAIPQWVEMGAQPSDICEALGMASVNSLRTTCSRHGISLHPIGPAVLRALAPAQARGLKAEARRRDLSAGMLMLLLIGAVADKNLFATVLGGAAGKRAVQG
jgi:hypothetical protein